MALDKATFLKPRPRQIVLIDCGLEQPARLRALLESERIEFDVWIKNSKGEISDAKMKKSNADAQAPKTTCPKLTTTTSSRFISRSWP